MTGVLESLIASPVSPPFIFVHHPHTASTSVIPDDIRRDRRVKCVQVDTVEHHSARIFYSGLLGRLRRALGVDAGEQQTEVISWDGFARDLRDVWERTPVGSGSVIDRKGKGKAENGGTKRNARLPNGTDTPGESKDARYSGVTELSPGEGEEKSKWVLVITHAERLPRILGPQWAAVTRLSELVGIPATVVLASQTPWDILRPPSADAPEPVHHYIPASSRQQLTTSLLSASAHPLWRHFLSLILATLAPLVSPSTSELVYLSGPLWQLYTATLPPHAEQHLLGRPCLPADHPNGDSPSGATPPLDVTVKLLTDLKYQISLPLTLASEHLITRRLGPREFVRALRPSSNPLAPKRGLPALPGMDLPLVGKFLVVAGYLATQNPAKTDLRLFGRGVGPEGRRKRGGGTRRAGYGRVKVGKVPQRLLGPKPFPLDRLLAIFSSLYAEHAERPPDLLPSMDDAYDDSSSGESGTSDESDHSVTRQVNGDAQRAGANGQRCASAVKNGQGSLVERQRARVDRKRKRDVVREERWEDEVDAVTMGVPLWSMRELHGWVFHGLITQIPELEAQGLFKRVSPVDRLDNVMLRCEVDYESAKTVARELKIVLDEYLYEATT